MSHLDELREESPEIAEAIEQNETEIRDCPRNCSDCHRMGTCFNEKERM